MRLLLELQREAQINENSAQVEKLAKTIVAAMKQLQAQRLLERETLEWDELQRFNMAASDIMAEEIRARLPADIACEIINAFHDRIMTFLEGARDDD